MNDYCFPKGEKSVLEALRVPLAVYRYVNKRIVTVLVTDGFCELFGYKDRSRAIYEMDHDMYADAHPDDTARIEEAAVRIGVYRDSDDKTVPVSIAGDRAKLACDSLRGPTKSAFCYYKSELREKELKKQYILDNFEEALSERRIEIHYQPIIRSVNGRVCGEEALSRWNEPQSGLLPPAEFIPILEESRLVYKLDLYLLERVLEKITRQKEEGLTIVPRSINLSGSDFDSCDIVEEIRRRRDVRGDRENARRGLLQHFLYRPQNGEVYRVFVTRWVSV